MLALDPILIPIIAITLGCMIPIFAIYFNHKQKSREMDERKMMIEKGITPPPLSEYNARPERKSNPLYRALNLLALGTGLIVGYSCASLVGLPLVYSVIAFVLLFLGIASFISITMSKKEDSDER